MQINNRRFKVAEGIKVKFSKGKRIGFYFLVFLINLILFYFIGQSFHKLQFFSKNIKIIKFRERVGKIEILDLNGDGKEEIISSYVEEPRPYRNILGCFTPFQRRAGDLKLTYFWEVLIKKEEGLFKPQDIDNDGKIDIPIIELNKKGILLKLLDIEGHITKRIKFPIFSIFSSNAFFKNVLFDDINRDGSREMIVYITTAWEGLPRGVIAYNVNSRKKLWEFYCGCMPWDIKIVDLNKDGKKEIILSGWGSHNNVSINGTDDDHSYIIVLDHEGKLIWKKIYGGYYTRIYFDIADIDADGELEIITSKECHREYSPEPGEIRIIDAKSGVTEKYIIQSNCSFSNIYQINFGNNSPQIIVGDSRGKVTIYDKNLNKIKEIYLEYPAIVRGIERLGTDSNKYIFVQAGFTNFYILNQKLKKIYKFKIKNFTGIENAVYYYPIRNKNIISGVLNADGMYLFKKDPVNILVFVNSLLESKLAYYISVLLIFNLLIYYFEKLKKKTPETQATLKNLIELIHETAHKIKNRLFTIQLEAENVKAILDKEKQKGSMSKNLDYFAQSIMSEVQAMKRIVRGIMSLIEEKPLKFKKVELNFLIERLVEKYKKLLEGKVKFELELDENSTSVTIDKELVEEALSNIIENSIEALPNGGKIIISTTVIYSPLLKTRKGVEVEIIDNGKGIPEDKIEDIFNPYFTTKKEGIGLGLTLTKRIIDAHGGRIEVQSRIGIGTKFALFFPVREES
jgi:signal transduction histidine kinase